MTDGIRPSAVDELKINELRQELFDFRTLRVPIESLLKVKLTLYLWAAVFQASAVQKSQAQEWKTPAWDFGRFARTHPDLFDLDSGSALQKVRETIGAEFWSERLNMNLSDAEMAFDAVWNDCRSIPGRDQLTAAIERAKCEVRGSVPNLPAGFGLFLAIARCLQEAAADRPFPLAVRALAARLACEPMTISRYRKKAVQDGHLEIVKQHSYRAGGRNEATEFRFITRSE